MPVNEGSAYLDGCGNGASLATVSAAAEERTGSPLLSQHASSAMAELSCNAEVAIEHVSRARDEPTGERIQQRQMTSGDISDDAVIALEAAEEVSPARHASVPLSPDDHSSTPSQKLGVSTNTSDTLEPLSHPM